MSEVDDDIIEEPTKPRRPGLPVDIHRLGHTLRGGARWIGLAALIGAVAGLSIAHLAIGDTYEASASIRYEGLPGEDHFQLQRQLPAKVSVTHSEPMMRRLRQRTGLGDLNIEQMRRRVQVESDPGSGLVAFTTTGDSAEGAASMANTLVELFLAHHRVARREQLVAGIASLEERAEAASAALAEARSAYDSFRQANAITDLSAEQEQAIAQAAELRSQADLAQADVQSLVARVAQLERQLAATPRTETVSAGASQGARRIRELRQRLAEARGQGLGADHPTVMSLEGQIDELSRSRIGGDATRTSINSVHSQLRSALAEAQTELEAIRERHVGLDRLAQEAHARTTRNSRIEGDAANLLAQVNVEQAFVQEMSEQRARMDDELRDVQTGFRTVADARAPESAVPSKKKFAVAIGVPLALALLVMAALVLRELRGMRVQTPTEVAWWGDGPVIGTTRWPREPRALMDLIADMDDFAPAARGTMLVVGATEEERDLGAEIARQLNHDWSPSNFLDVPTLGALPSSVEDPLPLREDDDVEVSSEELEAEPIFTDDEPIRVEIQDPPEACSDEVSAELVLYDAGASDITVGYVDEPLPTIETPADQLVCTAWNGACEGQALRRAARLADRVLVVVTSDAMKAAELATTKSRLGRDRAVGYVLIGVSEPVAKLPDRAGPVQQFWEPR